MSQTANGALPKQVQQKPPLQNKQRFNARDGNREQHLQAFFAWLHPDLHSLPGIDWTKMPSHLIGYLVNTVGDAYHAPHLALVAGVSLGVMGIETLSTSISDLHVLLSFIQKHCDSWDGQNVTRAVWEEYVTKVEQTSRRKHILTSYSALTERHLPDFLEQQTTEIRSYLAPYVLPRLPARFMEQYSGAKKVVAEQRQRRKEKSDVLVPLHSILVALVQLRKQAAQRLLLAFREACQRAEAGEELPLCFSYEEELVEINRDAITVADVRLEKRRVILAFKLWKRQAWIKYHQDDFSKATKRKAKQGKLTYQSDRERYFVEFLGQPDDLLWIGNIVANGILMHLQGFQRRGYTEAIAKKRPQQLAYAKSIGVPQGFAADCPGVLTADGHFGQWLATVVQSSEALIFDPESLYRGCLFGAALATLALTEVVVQSCFRCVQIASRGIPMQRRRMDSQPGKSG
jgi:hypothetical protein